MNVAGILAQQKGKHKENFTCSKTYSMVGVKLETGYSMLVPGYLILDTAGGVGFLPPIANFNFRVSPRC
jgi:hypothetical protein